MAVLSRLRREETLKSK